MRTLRRPVAGSCEPSPLRRAVCSSRFPSSDGAVLIWWLRVIYGKRGMPPGMGLVFRMAVGEAFRPNKDISFAALWDKLRGSSWAGRARDGDVWLSVRPTDAGTPSKNRARTSLKCPPQPLARCGGGHQLRLCRRA